MINAAAEYCGSEAGGGLQRSRGLQVLSDGENLVSAFLLALLAVLPVAEMMVRKLFGAGISGSASMVQHIVLFIGMLGGAIAAREGRLLGLATVTCLPGAWRSAAKLYGNAIGAVVAGLLSSAGMEFALSRRPSGEVLAYGIPVWVLQLALPLGFGLIAMRLVWRASGTWRGRIAALVPAGMLCAAVFL